ncbi:MAG: cytochrome c3 family protein [Chromatiaceae bacterium]
MPQIFKPRANDISRSVLVAVGVLIVIALGAVETMVLLPYVTAVGMVPKATRVGITPEQPLPFSHKHHVREVGLDCRYCHTSVEDSAFAGIPPTYTCMTCHSQFLSTVGMLGKLRESLDQGKPIHWVRVNNLPGYVYFDHSIHVAKGVGCESCHGQIERMPLTRQSHAFEMDFCLDCHRDPAPHLRPKDAVTQMDWQPPKDRRALGERLMTQYGVRTAGLTSCSTCHR